VCRRRHARSARAGSSTGCAISGPAALPRRQRKR
jgi:hypothetical protein